MANDITFKNAPKWLHRYATKLHKKLCHEWTVIVVKLNKPIPHNKQKEDSVDAEIDIDIKRLEAKITIGPTVHNNVSGRRIVAHEFLHITLYEIGLYSDEKTEEQTVVKLSRIIEELT